MVLAICAGNPWQTLASAEPWLDPKEALAKGCWVKWIGGASNHDLQGLEDQAALATMAGAHCLDVAADFGVVAAVKRGIDWALNQGVPRRPWLMLSLNDGADPHFRKAVFDPQLCPSDCPKPCIPVCPARAIDAACGVIAERCYGCGRCLSICPLDLIQEQAIKLDSAKLLQLLQELKPDAIEVHTAVGRGEAFAQLLAGLKASGLPLKLLAVSCHAGFAGAGQLPYAAYLWQLHGHLKQSGWPWLWQLDGRPMSGDIGAGTAHGAIALLERWRRSLPPGCLQLAGGTNADSRRRLQRVELPLTPARGGIAGIAYGGSARSLLQPFLLEAELGGQRLLNCPNLWPQAQRSLEQLWAY